MNCLYKDMSAMKSMQHRHTNLLVTRCFFCFKVKELPRAYKLTRRVKFHNAHLKFLWMLWYPHNFKIVLPLSALFLTQRGDDGICQKKYVKGETTFAKRSCKEKYEKKNLFSSKQISPLNSCLVYQGTDQCFQKKKLLGTETLGPYIFPFKYKPNGG